MAAARGAITAIWPATEVTKTARPPKIRLVLVDDHAVLRAGLRMLLNAEPDMTVVGEAGDSETAAQLVRRTSADIVLLDLSIPTRGGVATTGMIRTIRPRCRVLILTVHNDPMYARQALAQGAAGYVVKDADATELLASIRAVHKGRTVIHLGEADGTVTPPVPSSDRIATPAAPRPHAQLSARERRVLKLVAFGYTSREIATRLSVSPKTVETYRARLGAKLDLRTRAELVSYAVGLGLLRDPDE